MTTEPQTAEEIFYKAIELDDQSREAFLDDACGDDRELRQEVEKLVTDHARAGDFLEVPAAQVPTAAMPPIAEGPGQTIGRYKLLEQIGEGGFGVVFMAEQVEPIRRKVAVKIIKPGMDTKEVIARFEAERQALALMDHPNIAKVLDAGATESGRPYFVMQLVRGIPITEYCDKNHLTPPERLELFVSVCQAVQHAHQKGVIHRDLKPSNVLVTMRDDRPIAKVIDFGVSKATNQRLTERTFFTRFSQMIGTPLYMSPEQAQMSELDVDTRSDIYSLGVLLYELLTGTTPFDKERIQRAAYDELLHIIRDEEPPRPSLRLSTSDSLPSIAANRQVEPSKLSGLVRGELDWIVMKALEKDRTRRYETANGFANDIQRYLNDEPVVACPPSSTYRLGKFARRNRGAIVATSVVLAALLLGVIGTTWQAIRASQAERDALGERDRAVDAERLASDRLDRAIAAENRAKTEAERANQEAERTRREAERAETGSAVARAVYEFLANDLLSQADPNNEPDRDITLRAVVDRASERIVGQFNEQPQVEAAVRHTLGDTYRSLGEYRIAKQHYLRAAVLNVQTFGNEHINAIKSQNDLAWIYHLQRRNGEAALLAEEELKIARRVLGEEHETTLRVMNTLACVYTHQKRPSEAQPLLEKCLEASRATHGDDDRNTRTLMNNLAVVYEALGRHDEAAALINAVIESERQALEEQGPKSLTFMQNQAKVLRSLGRNEEAKALIQKVLEERLNILGAAHPETETAVRHLEPFFGRTDRSESLLRRLLKERTEVLGPDHPLTLNGMIDLGLCLYRQKRWDEANVCYREVVARDPENARALGHLGEGLTVVGKAQEALPYHNLAVELDSASGWQYFQRAKTCYQLRKWDESLANAKRAIELTKERCPPWMLNADLEIQIGSLVEMMQYEDAISVAHDARLTWPAVNSFGLMHAQALALAGQMEEYRRACVDKLGEAGVADNAWKWHYASRMCTLTPNAISDPARLLEWAKSALPQGRNARWDYHALGMICLRAQQLTKAEEFLRQALSTDATPWDARYVSWFGLTLLEAKRANLEAARANLETAIECMREAPPTPVWDQLEAKILRREAEQLMKPESNKAERDPKE